MGTFVCLSTRSSRSTELPRFLPKAANIHPQSCQCSCLTCFATGQPVREGDELFLETNGLTKHEFTSSKSQACCVSPFVGPRAQGSHTSGPTYPSQVPHCPSFLPYSSGHLAPLNLPSATASSIHELSFLPVTPLLGLYLLRPRVPTVPSTLLCAHRPQRSCPTHQLCLSALGMIVLPQPLQTPLPFDEQRSIPQPRIYLSLRAWALAGGVPFGMFG